MEIYRYAASSERAGHASRHRVAVFCPNTVDPDRLTAFRFSFKSRSGPLASAIQAFFDQASYAVVGASRQRHKFGNQVLRLYQRLGWTVLPINPHAEEVEGLPCVSELQDLEEVPDAISVITPPHVTTSVVREAIRLGIRHIWLQPGAESPEAVADCRAAGIDLIWGGPCILVDAPA